MRRVWLIGGTADAKALAHRLVDQGYSILATVATEQGGELWPECSGLETRVGRLSEEEMSALLASEEFLALVDGSHPYAQIVSEQAARVAQKASVPYLRLGREQTPLGDEVQVFPSVAAVADFLRSQEGKIFSTLGSKELDPLAALPDARERLVARVLPTPEVLQKCADLGLGTPNIIAMMGPFSLELNRASFQASGAKWLVTKDSGKVGGMDDKLKAALELGMKILVVGRPVEGAPTYDADGICAELARLSGSSVVERGVEAEKNPLPFPLFFNLRGPVLVVGGGPVALRRVRGLLDWGAEVICVSPSLSDLSPCENRAFTWLRKPYDPEDLKGCSLVVACTDDGAVNSQIEREARAQGILVNRADDHGGTHNDFIFPALIRRGDDLAAVSTAGASPLRCAALAGKLRAAWGEWCDEAPLGRPLRLGTRRSALALVQTERARAALLEKIGLDSEAVGIETTGDVLTDRRLEATGGKGLFAREIERALGEGELDGAVHSLKDMPFADAPNLTFAALFDRAYPFDCLVLRPGLTEAEVRRIGTSSRRRTMQGGKLFPQATFSPLRGNLNTRLEKLDRGEFDALILAEAGLRRLGLEDRISRVFTLEEMVPGAGQGALALQCRTTGWAQSVLSALDDSATRLCCECERAFVALLGGGCTAPHGAYAQLVGEEILLTGLYVTEEGELKRGSIKGEARAALTLAQQLATRLQG